MTVIDLQAEKWILMSTEYSRRVPDGMVLVFMGEDSGSIYKLPKGGVQPYGYTLMTEKEMRNLPEIQDNFIEGGEWNDRIMGMERIEKIHPITQKHVNVTKIYGSTTWDIHNWKKKNGILDYLPKELVFNVDDKYADYFLREVGLTMGMTYSITENGFEMIEPHYDNEVQGVIDNLETSDLMNYALKNKFISPFFIDFPDISNHIIACDIEVDNDYKQAIQPEDAKYPISSIAYYTLEKAIVFTLDDETRDMMGMEEFEFPKDEGDFSYREYSSEKKLLDHAFRYLLEISGKSICVMFNGDRFDIIYMCSRAKILGLKKYEEFIWGRYEPENDRYIKGIKNMFLVDLYPFFKNPSIKVYAFKNKYPRNGLKHITDALLGHTKYEFEGYISDLSSRELAYYNFIDTKRTFELCTFNNNIVMNLIFMFMRISGRTFEDVHRRNISAVVKGVIDSSLHFSDILIPNWVQLSLVGKIESEAIIDDKQYEGAFVFDPNELDTVGFWTVDEEIQERDDMYTVVCADFSSLYPTEIDRRNLCFSTINCEHETCEDNTVPFLGHWVCRERKGIIASLIGFIRNIRVEYFKKNKDKYPTYPIVEQVLKVLINASYGVMGNERFPYYTAPLAESTTAYGRRDIKKVAEYVETNGIKVLYGDTDSVFLHKVTDDFLKRLFVWVSRFLDQDMGIDYKGNFMGIWRKKCYFVDNDGKLIVKGLSGKKSNTPEYVRKCFMDVLDIIKDNYDDIEEMKKKIIGVVDKYLEDMYLGKMNPLELSKTISMGKPIGSYDRNYPHVVAGRKLAQFYRDKIGDMNLPDEVLIPQDTYIEYIKTKSGENIPVQMVTKETMVDVHGYKQKLIKTLSQVLIPLGIDLEYFDRDYAIVTLDNFF